ncbi:MAG: FAD-dependent oxidoreductase, partial [Turicibacter sp.]
MKQVFDAIIIGFGKGGKTLAASMASKGLKVALIEKSPNMYGGTCINKACIPTKKLEDLSSQVKALNLTSWESKQAFYQKAIADKETLITALRQANYQKLDAFDNLSIITGEASFIDEKQVAVRLLDGETMTLQADKIFINTGTKPFMPAIKGIKTAAHVYSSDELLNLENLPKSLTIIGAGFIGLEFASIYSAFGTQVTVIHPGETILPQEDSDDRESIIAHFNKKGV